MWYTWAPRGLEGEGSGIYAASQGLAGMARPRRQWFDRVFSFSLPATVSASTAPGNVPPSLIFVPRDGERVVALRRFAGTDAGRRRRTFAHVITELPAAFTARDAVLLWMSPCWRQDIEGTSSGILPQLSQEELVPGPLGKLNGRSPRLEMGLKLALSAILSGGQEPVIVFGAPGYVVSLIEAVCSALPSGITQQLAFSTYEADLSGGWVRELAIVGQYPIPIGADAEHRIAPPGKFVIDDFNTKVTAEGRIPEAARLYSEFATARLLSQAPLAELEDFISVCEDLELDTTEALLVRFRNFEVGQPLYSRGDLLRALRSDSPERFLGRAAFRRAMFNWAQIDELWVAEVINALTRLSAPGRSHQGMTEELAGFADACLSEALKFIAAGDEYAARAAVEMAWAARQDAVPTLVAISLPPGPQSPYIRQFGAWVATAAALSPDDPYVVPLLPQSMPELEDHLSAGFSTEWIAGAIAALVLQGVVGADDLEGLLGRHWQPCLEALTRLRDKHTDLFIGLMYDALTACLFRTTRALFALAADEEANPGVFAAVGRALLQARSSQDEILISALEEFPELIQKLPHDDDVRRGVAQYLQRDLYDPGGARTTRDDILADIEQQAGFPTEWRAHASAVRAAVWPPIDLTAIEETKSHLSEKQRVQMLERARTICVSVVDGEEFVRALRLFERAEDTATALADWLEVHLEKRGTMAADVARAAITLTLDMLQGEELPNQARIAELLSRVIYDNRALSDILHHPGWDRAGQLCDLVPGLMSQYMRSMSTDRATVLRGLELLRLAAPQAREDLSGSGILLRCASYVAASIREASDIPGALHLVGPLTPSGSSEAIVALTLALVARTERLSEPVATRIALELADAPLDRTLRVFVQSNDIFSIASYVGTRDAAEGLLQLRCRATSAMSAQVAVEFIQQLARRRVSGTRRTVVETIAWHLVPGDGYRSLSEADREFLRASIVEDQLRERLANLDEETFPSLSRRFTTKPARSQDRPPPPSNGRLWQERADAESNDEQGSPPKRDN